MSLQINALNTSTTVVKPKTPPGREFTISPSLYGRTRWNLDNLSRMNISSSGQWTITPTSNFTANVKMWGGAGGSSDTGYGVSGAGGYSSGTASFSSGVPYVLIVGGGGKSKVVGSGYPATGGGGYTSYASIWSTGGGGMSGIFRSSYSQNNSVLIAGGGGSHGFGGPGYGGAGGGTSGQNAERNNSYGGTQTAGGGGQLVGQALQGGSSFTSASYQCGAGGGGYFGGGAYNSMLGSGAGGSGYINTTIVTNGYTVAGSKDTPGNSSDVDRGSSGQGTGDVKNGNDGRVIIS